MKKVLVCVIALFGTASVSAGGLTLQQKDGVPQGSVCCVKNVCLIAQNDADCVKAGGKVVKDCEACGSQPKPATPKQK
jgi:hypothetical protein